MTSKQTPRPKTGKRPIPGYRTRPEPNIPEPASPLVETDAAKRKRRPGPRITTR